MGVTMGIIHHQHGQMSQRCYYVNQRMNRLPFISPWKSLPVFVVGKQRNVFSTKPSVVSSTFEEWVLVKNNIQESVDLVVNNLDYDIDDEEDLFVHSSEH